MKKIDWFNDEENDKEQWTTTQHSPWRSDDKDKRTHEKRHTTKQHWDADAKKMKDKKQPNLVKNKHQEGLHSQGNWKKIAHENQVNRNDQEQKEQIYNEHSHNFCHVSQFLQFQQTQDDE